MTGYVYIGDPFSATAIKFGPLTVKGSGDVQLQNQTGHDLAAGPYLLKPNQYLNQQADGAGGRSYGALGAADKAGPWETWRLTGSIVGAWNGESYAFAILP